MPKHIPVHLRWVQKYFLSLPEVKALGFTTHRRTGSVLTLTSPHLQSGLSVEFHRQQVLVCFEQNGDLVDVLRWYEFTPKMTRQGRYFCSQCEQTKGEELYFDSMSLLYVDHCLKELVNDVKYGVLTRPIRWEVTDGFSYAEFIGAAES